MNAGLSIEEVLSLHEDLKNAITARLAEFRSIWETGSEEVLFQELAFCLLTPQSKARSCWQAAEGLKEEGQLFEGDAEEIRTKLARVRFNRRKASYIIEAREIFREGDRISVRSRIDHKNPERAREWLVENIKGMGWKEASHFLRNVGLGENLAILDRHILKNLALLGVMEETSAAPTGRKYVEIEEKMRRFARSAGLPMAHLDFVLWSKETGEIFK